MEQEGNTYSAMMLFAEAAAEGSSDALVELKLAASKNNAPAWLGLEHYYTLMKDNKESLNAMYEYCRLKPDPVRAVTVSGELLYGATGTRSPTKAKEILVKSLQADKTHFGSLLRAVSLMLLELEASHDIAATNEEIAEWKQAARDVDESNVELLGTIILRQVHGEKVNSLLGKMKQTVTKIQPVERAT